MAFDHIAVLGGGAWGSALANVAARAGRTVTLWLRNADAAAAMRATRAIAQLPGMTLDPSVAVTSDIAQIESADAVLIVVPAQALRDVATGLAPFLRVGTPVVACAKGIERGTHAFMTEIVAACAPGSRPAILSGPSFAADVARGLPTAVTLAAEDEGLAAALAQALGSAMFRPYHSTDVRGVEIGGAAKNVLAIAAGIAEGRELGASASAALVTRGFAELFRFGKAFGARPETLVGLSGLGDLVLTCSSPQSRNFSLGLALGKGRSLADAQSGKLTEGVFTASVLNELAQAHAVDMPIASAVAAVLDGRSSVTAAIESLLSRPFREE
ncbi:MAG TPA: NAD(P)H-dependent glycerol-3-phosphate dehydrogenase [Xanthobacteraceae bacterium]|nr:NAD(P)H-dependent glycerol-3-phosphate dehydrogenase [Xanthobacteraceae bacterium]